METPSTNGSEGLPARGIQCAILYHSHNPVSEGIKETAAVAGRRSSNTLGLEAELRTNGHTEIVMCAAIEEDIVSGFQSQANGSGEGFDTSRGIECEVSSPAAESNRIRKPVWNFGPKKPCKVRRRVVTADVLTPLL